MVENAAERIQRHYALSDLFQLYAILLKAPSASLAEGLVAGNAFDDLSTILAELGIAQSKDDHDYAIARAYCALQDPKDMLHELRKEYTRLFVRTSKLPEVPIYESFLEIPEGSSIQPLLFVNEIATELSALYKTVGLVRSNEFNNSEDHFAFQFEFLSRIHLVLSTASEAYAAYDAELRNFYGCHFEQWMTRFFTSCETKTEVQVYRFFWRTGKNAFEEILSYRG